MGMPSNGDVNLNLMEYDYTNYQWGVSAESSTPTKQIHANPLSVTAPTSLVLAAGTTEQLTKTDGTAVNRIKVSWTASADVFSVGYEVQYKLSTDTNYTEIARSTSNTEVVAWIEGITSGVQYDVRVRAYNGIGVVSAWLSGNVTGTGVMAVGDESNLIGTDDYLSDTFFYRNRCETLDGLSITGAVTIDTTAGTIVITAPQFNSGQANKVVVDSTPPLSWGRPWKFRTDFTITTGTGQYGSTTSAHQGGVGSTDKFGYVVKWNGGTAKLDIYARSVSGASTTDTLITSINDTGIKVDVRGVFTPGVNVVITLTIASVEYSATITTNLPTTGSGAVQHPMTNLAIGTNAIAFIVTRSNYVVSQQ
jgi:hypothetical protein